MGVIYLLAYIAGGLFVTAGGWNVTRSVLDGSPLAPQLQLVLVGIALVVVAALLHAWTEKRRNAGQPYEPIEPPTTLSLAIALAVWALPIITAWIQFELFLNPIRMAIEMTVLGGVVFAFLLARRLLKPGPLRGPGTMVVVALFGVPFGLVGAVLPLSHFTHHLSDVAVTIFAKAYSPYTKTVTFHRDTVTAPSDPAPNYDATLDLGAAIADARPADPDVEATGNAADLERMLESAYAADRERNDAERDARLGAWHGEVERRKRGGRLITRAH